MRNETGMRTTVVMTVLLGVVAYALTAEVAISGNAEEKSGIGAEGQITVSGQSNATQDADTSKVPQPPSKHCHGMKNISIPSDYKLIAGLGYYKVHREEVKWETARRICSTEGAHLLILNSQKEATEVVAASEMPEWNWLGFDDYCAEGEFITFHKTTIEETGYREWASGEPAKDLRCGVANNKGLLGSGNCDLQRGFICELHSPYELVNKIREPHLPMGYRRVGDLGIYRVRHDRVKWETARRRCQKEGAHLVVANTEKEAQAVFGSSNLPGWFWVGFDDFEQKGDYVNFDGQHLNDTGVYSSFAPQEPTPNLHCGLARKDSLLGTGNCNLRKEYICELGVLPPRKTLSPTPPPGYITIGNYENSLYKVHRDEASWETARRRCQDEGSHLMFVNSQEEADEVLKHTDLPEWFWLGFDDYSDEGEFVYFNGTRVEDSGYAKWAKNEPTNNLDCGVAKKNGLLGSGTCKIEREYVCEWNKHRVPPLPSPYPPGYFKIDDLGVYKVHRDRVAWETARRKCRAEGAHLLIVNSKLEADKVLKTSGLPGWFWLGFDDFDLPGQYTTLDGKSLKDAGYEEWDSEEPDEKFDCGVGNVKGLLGTQNCNKKIEFICELKKISI